MDRSKSDINTRTNWGWKLSLVLVILIALFSFRLWQTTGCRQFRSFWLSPQAVIIKVEEDVGTDRGQDRNISRFFHNKYQSRFILTIQSLTSALDTRLLIDILGPVGIAAFGVAVYTTIKTKKMPGILHLFSLFPVILFATFTPWAKQSFYLYMIVLYSFSIRSTKSMAKLSILLILALAVVSFWYFSFSWQLESFCHEIFFN